MGRKNIYFTIIRYLTLRFPSKAEGALFFVCLWVVCFLSSNNLSVIQWNLLSLLNRDSHFVLCVPNIWFSLHNTRTLQTLLCTRWDGRADWKAHDWLSCSIPGASRKVFTRCSFPQEFTFAVLSLGVSLVTDAHGEPGRNAMGAA